MSQDTVSAENHEVPRSTFVTVLSWVLIVGAGFLTLISVMQALMFFFVLPTDRFWSTARPPKGIETFPPLIQLLLSNVRLVFLMNWLLILLTLVSSIGLLYRKNWARIIIVCIFGVGIVLNLGGIWLQSQMFSSLPHFSARAPAGFTQQMDTMVTVMRIGSGIFAVAIAGLLAWLIKRLASRPVRGEFGAL